MAGTLFSTILLSIVALIIGGILLAVFIARSLGRLGRRRGSDTRALENKLFGPEKEE